MAAVTCIYPVAGTVTTPVAVNDGDTLSGNDIEAGASFTVHTAGTACDVSFTDPGTTPAGTAAGTPVAVTVATNTARTWNSDVLRNYIDPATNTVEVNYTAVTNVKCQFMAT